MVYITRGLEKELRRYISSKEMLAVVGPRQCGKSTMVNKVLDDLEQKGKKVSRVSFDNIKVLQLFEHEPDSFYEQYGRGFDILFIDEVQYAKQGGKQLKYLYDTYHPKIILTGSSAADLSVHSLKYLVGRILIFVLYPFSFNEFLSAKDARITAIFRKGDYSTTMTKQFNILLDEYILFGGYPRVVLAKSKEEKKKILEGSYTIYLLKEIREILDLSSDEPLVNLLKALSLQIGSMISYNELSSLTGFSFHDLKKYLNILEKSFICRRLLPYYTNRRTELVKIPKVYFIDFGFRNICIDNFTKERSDKGSLYENFIFSELLRHKGTLRYWRTKSGAEVDFIMEKPIMPIEIKSSVKSAGTTKSFSSFVEKYRPPKGYVLSLELDSKMRKGSTKIFFLPFVKFASSFRGT